MKVTRKRTFYLTPEEHRNKTVRTINSLKEDKNSIIKSDQFSDSDAINWYNPMISYVIRKHKRYAKSYHKNKDIRT